MKSEQEATKILNAGEVKFSAEEVRQITDLMVHFAAIEYEEFLRQKATSNEHENINIHEPRKTA